MKKRKVEAWAVIPSGSDPTDVTLRHDVAKNMAELKVHQPVKIVHLVEADPAAEAELRDLRKLAKLCGESSEWRSRDAHLDAIYAEVERQKRKGKR